VEEDLACRWRGIEVVHSCLVGSTRSKNQGAELEEKDNENEDEYDEIRKMEEYPF
jgi:hypothetical protein